jgi:hypothetical protein
MSDSVVVVLSFQGRADTELCVKSLVEGSSGARIVVIDNGSFDGVLESVTGRWPQVNTLQTRRNLGFSGGMNAGLTWALDAGAATVTVLNNDTMLPRGAISRRAAVAHDGAAVSPEVRYADGSGQLWFGGGIVDREPRLARHLSEPGLDIQPGARFLRRHVLPHVVGPAGRQDWREASRRALVVATALADGSRNKSGEAPPLLQPRARAWAAQ